MVSYTIEEKQREIELLENLSKEIVDVEIKKAEVERYAKEKEKQRRNAVFSFFKTFARRDMTEEEYVEYLELFKNSERGFNIFEYAEQKAGNI